MLVSKGKKGSGKTEILESLDSPTTAQAEAFGLVLSTVVLILFGLLCLYSVMYPVDKGGSIASASVDVTTVKETIKTVKNFGREYNSLIITLKQFGYALLGLVVSFFVVRVGYRRMANACMWAYFGIALLLIMAIVPPFRHPVKGACRWIFLGPVQIQPAELAKVVLVLFWSEFLARRSVEMKERPFFRVLVPITLFTLFIIGLILIGRDLGTSVLLLLVFFLMLVVAGCPTWLTCLVPSGLIAFVATLSIPAVMDFWSRVGLLPPYRVARLLSYRNPELYADKTGYQLWLSELALGSGGWFGRGFAQSRMKYEYLPEAHTDCILSVVGEETGFVFMLLIMVFYCCIGFCGYRIAAKARTKLGTLIAFGMTTFLLIQAFINMGVVCGALPTKGMPAPFISYGGSSMLACTVAVGFIFSVAWDNMHPESAENGFLKRLFK